MVATFKIKERKEKKNTSLYKKLFLNSMLNKYETRFKNTGCEKTKIKIYFYKSELYNSITILKVKY